MTGAAVLEIHVGQRCFVAALNLLAAPRACGWLLAHLPLRVDLVPARWSGPLCLARKLEWPCLDVENPTAMLAPGDLVLHLQHRDIAMAYGPTAIIEQTRPAYVTRLAQVTQGMEVLVAVGNELQSSGGVASLWRRQEA